MLLTVRIKFGSGEFGKAHNLQDEGDFATAIADTIADFRTRHPEISLLDASIEFHKQDKDL
jgi:hypothetical protein